MTKNWSLIVLLALAASGCASTGGRLPASVPIESQKKMPPSASAEDAVAESGTKAVDAADVFEPDSTELNELALALEDAKGEPDRHLTPQRADLLPFLDFQISNAVPNNMVGGYTRFQAVGEVFTYKEGEGIGLWDRNGDKPDLIARLLSSQSLSRVLTVKLTLSRPKISTTTTLASVSYNSKGENGQTWVSELNGVRALTPYVRIDPDSAVTIEATVNASKTTDSGAARAVIDAVQEIAKFAAPQATLVTSLNSQRIDAGAKVADRAISRLFSQTVEEKSKNDLPVSYWNNSDIFSFDIYFPVGKKINDLNSRAAIGTWQIRAEEPIVSIFSNTLMCQDTKPKACTTETHTLNAKKAFAALSFATVLNFSVGENQTVADVLRADEAIAQELAKAQTTQAFDAAAARSLCAMVSTKAEALGFNRYDVAAILWALSESNMMDSAAATTLMQPDTCAAAALWRAVGPSGTGAAG